MHYNQLLINTDGGSRGNPGPAAIGVTANTSSGEVVFELSEYIGVQTNNVAEYMAVIRALTYLNDQKISTEKLTFILDSQLIVRQIQGIYRVKESHLQSLVSDVKKLLGIVKENNPTVSVSFQTVLRDQNKRADQLVNQALDANT